MAFVPEIFQLTFGCQLIAYFLDSVCYGVAMILVVQYFRSFMEDGKPMMLFVNIINLLYIYIFSAYDLLNQVGSLAVFATVHITFFTALVYEQYVLHFGDLPALDIMPHSAAIQLLAIYITAFTCQIFFATRIWIMSQRNVWLTTPIFILALLQISAGISQATFVVILGRFSRLATTEKITTIQSGATAACDVYITISLCWVLQKSRTGFKSTDGVLNNLIIFAINRGAITSLAALMNMTMFVARPEQFIFMIPLEPSCEFYVISVIATLLSRKSLREELNRSREGNAIPLGQVSIPQIGSREKAQDIESGVHITTSVVRWDSRQSDRDLLPEPSNTSSKDSSTFLDL